MLDRLEKWLLFLVILFLPTQLGKHFWPDFSYIYSLKIDYLSPTIYFWDLLVAGLLAVWILKKPKFNKLALNLFLFFLFTQALSLIGASNIGAGIVRLEQYALAGFFGVFLASQDFSKKIFLPLALGILGESTLTILQFIKGSTLGFWILGERTFSLSTPGIAKFDFYGVQFLRPYATFPHPNVLAGFMVVGLTILYYILREKRRLAGLTLVFGSMAVFLTMSRVAILAGLVVLALSIRRKWLVWMAVFFLIVSPILFVRFSSVLNLDNLTLLRRSELIGSAWEIFLRQPVFGVGLNNFIPTIAADLLSGPSRFLQPVHNIFLLALSETGIIGLIGLMILIGFPVLRHLRLYPISYLSEGKASFAYTLNPFLLPWFIILFLGMFDHYFLTLPQGYRMLFLIWGLSFSRFRYF